MKSCCVVIYPAKEKGEVSYIYGVFESTLLARAHYFADGSGEENPPEFLVLTLYGPDDVLTPADADTIGSTDVK